MKQELLPDFHWNSLLKAKFELLLSRGPWEEFEHHHILLDAKI